MPRPVIAAAYVWAVVIAGAVTLGVLLWHGAAEAIGRADLLLPALVIAVVIGELRPVRMGLDRGEVAPSTTFTFAIMMAFGTPLAALAQALGVAAADAVHRKPVMRRLFNVAQYALAVAAAGGIFHLVCGDRAAGAFTLRALIGVMVAGIVFFVLNTGAVAAAVALSTGSRLRDEISGDLVRQSANELVLLGLAPLTVVSVEHAPLLLPLLGLPLFAVNRAASKAVLSEQLAHHDALTGLPNRVLFAERTRQAIVAAQRRGDPVALMLLDLDRFKEINDTLGHHYGDEVLRQVSQRLAATVGATDTVARLGGDEFAILLPAPKNADAALDLARRARAALAAPLDAAKVRLEIGGSVGVAMFPEDGGDAEGLMQRADVAMYAAKTGNTGVARYSAEHDSNSIARLSLAGDLRRALEDGEFAVHFQPQVALQDAGRVVGGEALLRWRHPRLGHVSPEVFIAIAEQTGFVVPLTLHVLRESARSCAAWSAQGHDFTIAVNLSARLLVEPGIADRIAEIWREHGLETRQLVLEITESMVVADPERALVTLDRLADLGIVLAVDDFGTGYSSLEYLKRLPVGEVKIDRGFVISMLEDPRDVAIVRSTVHLGRDLGLRVVAEGVESAEARDVLAALGCHQAQGYYYSRPMPAENFLAWCEAYERERAAHAFEATVASSPRPPRPAVA